MTRRSPSPVREPAWQVSRGAIGLLGHRGRHRRGRPRPSARRRSCSSSRRRWAAPCRSCAGRSRSLVVALRGGGHRRAPAAALPGAPLGGHRRGGLHAHRLAVPHVDAGADLPHPDRRRHPRRDAAAVRAGVRRGADGVVARAPCGCRTWRPTSPSAWPTTWRAGRRRSATRRRDRQPPRTPDLAADPARPHRHLPAGAAVRARAHPARRGHRVRRRPDDDLILLAVGVTLLSLLTAALSWWRFSYADGPERRRRHPGAAVPVGAHRADRPHPGRRGRDAAAAPAVRPGPRAHRRRGRGGQRQRRGTGRRRRPPGRGRPAARRRPHATAPRRGRRAGGGRRRRAGARRGGVRPLRQPLAALRPAGRQLPRRPARRRRGLLPARSTSCRRSLRPDLDGPDLSGGWVPALVRRRRAAPAPRRSGRSSARRSSTGASGWSAAAAR